MSRIDYQMSPADLRTFDRWHARGAAILLAVLVLMPWLIGIGPNSVRHETAAASTGTAAPAGAIERPPASEAPATDTAATAAPAAPTDTAPPAAAAPAGPDVAAKDAPRR